MLQSTAQTIAYNELDYTFTHKGNTTTLTGVRQVNSSTMDVYLSGFTWVNSEKVNGEKTDYGAFVYKGPLTGGGQWYGNFIYPSYFNATVTGTFFYGPCNAEASGIATVEDSENFFQAVGDYETKQGKDKQFGLLFQGYLNGTGVWETLDPSPLTAATPGDPMVGTIAHSIMGGLVVGNFDTASAPSKSRSFVYEIASGEYHELKFKATGPVTHDDFSVTAYCIWHYAGTDIYAIAGGIGAAEAEDGFIVDWNNSAKNATNWRFFRHQNSTITHFQGMWPDEANRGEVGWWANRSL